MEFTCIHTSPVSIHIICVLHLRPEAAYWVSLQIPHIFLRDSAKDPQDPHHRGGRRLFQGTLPMICYLLSGIKWQRSS